MLNSIATQPSTRVSHHLHSAHAAYTRTRAQLRAHTHSAALPSAPAPRARTVQQENERLCSALAAVHARPPPPLNTDPIGPARERNLEHIRRHKAEALARVNILDQEVRTLDSLYPEIATGK